MHAPRFGDPTASVRAIGRMVGKLPLALDNASISPQSNSRHRPLRFSSPQENHRIDVETAVLTVSLGVTTSVRAIGWRMLRLIPSLSPTFAMTANPASAKVAPAENAEIRTGDAEGANARVDRKVDQNSGH